MHVLAAVNSEESRLEDIFQAMCECAALNPDDDDDDDDDGVMIAGEGEGLEDDELLTTEEAVRLPTFTINHFLC